MSRDSVCEPLTHDTSIHGALTINCVEMQIMLKQASSMPRFSDATLLATRWHVRLLGGIELHCGDLVVQHFASRPVAVLLARLALRPGRRHSREQLTEMMWQGVTPTSHA